MGNKSSVPDPAVEEMLRRVRNDEFAYTYLGHSSDMCDEIGKPLVVKVPDGSVIIQDGECGLVTYSNIFEKDPRHTVMITNTEEMTNISNPQKILADYRRLTGTQSASIHTPGDEHGFVNSHMTLLSDWIQVSGGHTILKMRRSGIYKFNYWRQYDNPEKFTYQVAHMQDLTKTPEISKTVISNMFEDSIYPTQEQVNELLGMITSNGYLTLDQYKQFRSNPLFELDFIDFIGKHPGVHFHHSCRSTSSKCDKLKLMIRRKNSMLFKNANTPIDEFETEISNHLERSVSSIDYAQNLADLINSLKQKETVDDYTYKFPRTNFKDLTPNAFFSLLERVKEFVITSNRDKLVPFMVRKFFREFAEYLNEQKIDESMSREYSEILGKWVANQQGVVDKDEKYKNVFYKIFFSKDATKVSKENAIKQLNAKRAQSLFNPPQLGRLGGKKTHRKRRRSFRKKIQRKI